MEIRTARRGPNAGGQFYGCTGWPEFCNETLPLETATFDGNIFEESVDQDRQYLPLSAITKEIQNALQPVLSRDFWIKAEISSGQERGGSFYCDLTESDQGGTIIAKIRCIIWNRDLDNIRQHFKDNGLDLQLDDGTLVGFRCAVQYSPQYGLSLRVIEADPAFVLGELELKRRQILERLTEEGLLDPNKKLTVPMLPLAIGLITSTTSAASNDFLTTLKASGYGYRIHLADAMMQGEKVEHSIVKALDVLESANVELVVITRGGGSKTELYSLDNEAIARRIAQYGLPVWTAIGHETDTSILDYVANKNFRTPTAVAEELVDRYDGMKRYLDESRNRFESTWSYRLSREQEWLIEAQDDMVKKPLQFIRSISSDLKLKAYTLSSLVKSRLSTEEKHLTAARQLIVSSSRTTVKVSRKNLMMQRDRFRADRFYRRLRTEVKDLEAKRSLLTALDPRRPIEKGFALVYDQAGKIVRSVAGINVSDVLQTELSDGKITSKVSRIRRK
ncbi:MAG: exodeoxyribonuclease VII large subunit [Chloroflexi bacterium]|nr:exodeoxyribonuclease VII large subunit [Chloroflexota bacterium]